MSKLPDLTVQYKYTILIITGTIFSCCWKKERNSQQIGEQE
jgi:hypothetical protein